MARLGYILVAVGAGCVLLLVISPLLVIAIFTRQLTPVDIQQRYPWAVSHINEGRKSDLCRAFDLPPDDKFCQSDTRVYHSDVVRIIDELFPPGTAHAQVEARLGEFPHARRDDGWRSGQRVAEIVYAYQLTEYRGACIFFYLDSKGELVTQVKHSVAPQTEFVYGSDSGPSGDERLCAYVGTLPLKP
jgi:hypothetical protein